MPHAQRDDRGQPLGGQVLLHQLVHSRVSCVKAHCAVLARGHGCCVMRQRGGSLGCGVLCCVEWSALPAQQQRLVPNQPAFFAPGTSASALSRQAWPSRRAASSCAPVAGECVRACVRACAASGGSSPCAHAAPRAPRRRKRETLAGDATLRYFDYLEGLGEAFEGVTPNLFTGAWGCGRSMAGLHGPARWLWALNTRWRAWRGLRCVAPQRCPPARSAALPRSTLWTRPAWWTAT
jgi:hypothetical protein